MQVISRLHPYNEAKTFPVNDGLTLLDIVKEAEAPDWFYIEGYVTVDGVIYTPASWQYVKPKRHTIIELKANVQGGLFKKIGLVIAAAVLTIATGFIAAGGLAALGFGSAFAAGTLGANLAAAVMGIGGQLLLKALTPSPTLSAGEANAAQELSRAGVAGNPVSRGQLLPCIVGEITYSPPTLIPPYTTLEKGIIWAHTMVGLNGRNDVSNILVNEVGIDAIHQVQYDVREGSGLEGDTFLSTSYRLQDTAQQEMSRFKLKDESGDSTLLVDQDVPDNSAPAWHRYIKEADATELHIRLLFDGPIMNDVGDRHSVGFRIRLRKVGDVSWRNGPEFHIQDLKKSGGFRQEFKLIFDMPRGGNWVSRNDKLNCHVALKQSKFGAVIWNADSYFVQSAVPTTIIPVMSAATTSGVTISESSSFDATTVGWKAADNNATTTYWRPANNSLPAWLKVDHGTGKTVKSFGLRYASATTTNVRLGQLEGSNDNSTWDVIAEIETFSTDGTYYAQVDVVASYRYHRLVVEANDGAANAEVRVYELVLSTGDTVSQAIDSSDDFQTPFNASAGHVHLVQDGAEIYLDPTSWTAGAYEVEVKRSLAYLQSDFDLDSGAGLYQSDLWTYDTIANNFHFFDYSTSAKYAYVNLAQSKINSRCYIEAVTQVFASRPILAEVEAKLTRIALRAPGIQIRSISALFKGYAREWDGSVWVDTPVLSRNPAAYVRDALLLSDKNADPLPGILLEEDSLQDWFERCDSEGFTCDAVFSDTSMADAIRIMASCGYASLRQSNTFGVVMDYDRSAEDPVGVINPWDSQNLGTTVSFESEPHALRVSYFDATDNHREKEITVYRDGYSAANATDVQVESTYIGITSEAAATAKALYNLGQMTKRRVEYIREMGLAALTYRRGNLVLLVDKTIKRNSYYGIIKKVLTSGGNVTGFELYDRVRISESATDFEAIDDVDAGDTITFGITVRQRYGGTYTAEITETDDTDTVTLVTPVADTDQFIEGRPFSLGPMGLIGIRAILRWIDRTGPETFRLHFIPEANEIIP